MKVAVFSTKPYDRHFLNLANEKFGHELTYFDNRLRPETSVLAQGAESVSIFVNDEINAETIDALANQGVKTIALRCSGFNNVDLEAAKKHNIAVVRVPAYSPYAVAEHAIALLLSLNRKIYKARARILDGNFTLDGLIGFELNGLTVGVIGTGEIGFVVSRILKGFGCNVLGYDIQKNPKCLELGVEYKPLEEIFKQADILTLHCPLVPPTYHMINKDSLATMKDGVTIINTSRGALIDASDAIDALKSGKIGYLGLDVYEEEQELFFEDHSKDILQDDIFARLISFHNVVVTGHQAYFTRNALQTIAETTLQNITDVQKSGECANAV